MSSKMIQFTVWRNPKSKMGVWITHTQFKNLTYQEWCEREIKRFNCKASIRKNEKNQIAVWKEREINV